MKIEVSAGAVIIKKIRDVWNVLLIRDMNGNLTFPKGLVEENEKPVETAQREAREETGITGLKLIRKLAPILYFYTRNGEKIRKTVHYFLFSSSGTQKLVPQREEGISEILWMPLEIAVQEVGYPKTNKPVLGEVIKQLWKSQKHRT